MIEALLNEAVKNAEVEYNRQGMIDYTIDDAAEGWIIQVESKHDDCPDTSYLGTYTESPQGWYVDRKTGSLYHNDKCIRREIAGNDFERGQYQYWIYPWENDKPTIKHVMSLYKRCEEINRGDVWYVGIIVTVSFEGVELGYDSCWGIESDSDEDYINGMIHDVAAQAISAAMDKIAILKEKICC